MNRMNGLVGVLVSSLAVLVVVAAGWFFFVSPQRSKADQLGTQVDAAHSELMTDEQLIAAAKRQNTLGNAKAGELNGFAAQSRTEIDNITPGTALQVGNAQALPITLTFKGRYFGLQKLLKLMRQNAGVAGSTIVSKGRLYTVDSIQFAGAAAATAQNGNTSGSTGDIQATITLNAFVYNAVAPTATSTGTDSTATAAAPTD
jgi:hypothetical protein